MAVYRRTMAFLIIGLLFFVPGSAYSNDQSIKSLKDFVEIDSDELIINKAKSLVTFKGNVEVRFSTIKLITDLIIVQYYDKSKSGDVQGEAAKPMISKIEIPGKISGIYECQDGIIVADNGHYDGESKMLILNNVKGKKDGKILITKQLVYITPLLNITKK